jgi:predicted PurR-regulated permease PerM
MAGLKRDDHAFYLRHIRIFLFFIVLILSINLLYTARDFFFPVIIAFLIAITFRPIIRRLSVHGIPAYVTATGFAAILLVGGLLGAYLLSGPITSWIADAPALQQTFIEKIRAFRGPFQKVSEIAEQIRDAAAPLNQAEVQEVVVKEGSLPALLWIAGYPAVYTIMLAGAVVLSLFLMASGNLLYEKLLTLMPTLTDKKNALRLVHDVEHQVSNYLLALTAINAGVGIVVAGGFYLLGLKTAYLWAFVVFVLNFIPYAGPVLGVSVAGLVSIVTFDSIGYALIPPAFYTAVVTIENQFISPYFLSRKLRINSIAILLVLAFWGWLWGILGIVVAVPLLVTLRVLSSHVESLAAFGALIGESNSNVENGGEVSVVETPAKRTRLRLVRKSTASTE